MLDKYSSTIELIYSAALDGGRWQDALAAIEDLTNSVGAVIGFVPLRSDSPAFNIAGRFTEEQCATYSRDYQPICRRTKYVVENPGLAVVYDQLVLTEREMDSDPVYDWFGKHGLRYFAGAALPVTARYQPVFTIQRSPSQGHVESRDIDLFLSISPHLGQAVKVADQLGALRSVQTLSLAVLEAFPDAVFALNGTGEIVFLNAQAMEMLTAADGLRASDGKLQPIMPAEGAALDRVIRGGAVGGAANGGCLRISRRHGKPPYALSTVRLPAHGSHLFADAARVLVVVHDTAKQRQIGPEILRDMYGLTDAEARLASALATGHSLESAASLLGVRNATARSTLKSVFRKISVNRQQDLVRILTSMSRG